MNALIHDARPLYFTGADEAQDLSAHVRAGSGIRRWGERFVIVQDDVSALALYDASTGVVTPLLLPAKDGRRSFSEARGNKADKLDLEACFVLPDGRFVALGSGSTTARERIVLVDPDGRVRVLDGAPLYAALRALRAFAGDGLNLEGAVVSGGALRLFQRGNGAPVEGRAPFSAVADLSLVGFISWLEGGPLPSVEGVMRVELGEIRGVAYGFTDAAALPDGRVVFLAGAEDSPDTYRDGAVLGTRVGILDGDEVQLADIVDSEGAPTSLKLEGVELLSVDPSGALELLVIADMDDPELPAIVARVHWRS